MNTPVSFEIAKLLKEKGFDNQCLNFYTNPRCEMFGIDEHGRYYPIKNKAKSLWISGNAATLDSKHVYYAPTIAEVVMWLYEKHGIWISVNRVVIGSDEWDYGYIISYLPKEYEFEKRRSKHLVEIQSFKEGVGSYHGAWYTPTEAYEAAIEYTLNNLI